MAKFRELTGSMLAVCLIAGGLTGTAEAAPAWVDGHCKFRTPSLKWKDLTTRTGYSTPATSSIASWNATPTPVFITKVTSGANMTIADVNAGENEGDGGTYQSCVAGYNYVTTQSIINRFYADKYEIKKRQSVIAHEFGHALGLEHTTQSSDCTVVPLMFGGTAIRYDLCRWYTPKQDDIDGINALY